MDTDKLADGAFTLAVVLVLGVLIAVTIVGLLYCITVLANTTVG